MSLFTNIVVSTMRGLGAMIAKCTHFALWCFRTQLAAVDNGSAAKASRFMNLFHQAQLECVAGNFGTLRTIATYKLRYHGYVSVVWGNIVDFNSTDAAIVVNVGEASSERIATPYIKAEGPNFIGVKSPEILADKYLQLRQVHQECIDKAGEKNLRMIVFPLISCGECKGELSLEDVTSMSMGSILQWQAFDVAAKQSVEDIIFCVKNWREAKELVSVCDETFDGCLKVCAVKQQ